MGEWYITRRGRGLYTRSVALPLWARFFVPCTLLQSAILIGVNVAIGILSDDCLTSLILGISSLVTLFMCYFAIEAVRTENSYQLAAYVVAAFVFLSGYVPPIMGMSDGPHRAHMSGQHAEEVRKLLLVALICTGVLQLASLSFAALTYRLTHCGTAAFGMRTYKKVGTDPALLRCYATYQRFCSVLKLDWLLQLELLAFSLLGMQELTWQWWATVGAHAPIALVWPPLGLRSARRESGVLMGVLIVAAVAQPFLYAVQLLTLPPHDDTLPSPSHLSPHRTMMYCTRRLRERTFPFSSVPLDVVYALALLTRLLFLAASLLVRRNFGCGLAAVLHGRGNDSRAAGSSSFSGSGLAPDVFGSGSSSTHGVAAAEHLLPRPLPDHEAASGAALASGALPSLVLDVMDGGGPVTVPGGESMNGEGQRMSSSSSEPQLHQRLSRVESEESSASTGASGGPPLQRLTIGDGSASTAGAGSPPRSQPGSFS